MAVMLAGAAAPVLVVQTAQAAAPVDKQKEIAARKAFAAGDWTKALDLFAQLYAETLHPVYLRNIGRCHQKMRDPVKAIDAFRDYLGKGKNIAADERTEIEGYIKEMETLRDEQARAKEPDRPVTPPTTGSTEPGPDLRPTHNPPPPPLNLTSPAPGPADEPPIYKKWWFWTGVGAVVVGGVVAVLLLRSSSSDNCPPGVMCQ
jgi:hypothetical protein